MKYSEMVTVNSSGGVGTSHVENVSGVSSDSLDSRRSYEATHPTKSYDAVVFSVLRVPPEDFASQLTLMDLPVFKSIQPEELSRCAWNKRDKQILAPNVVAYTQRFNHVSFWTVKEILSAHTPKHRADVIGHFIKIAKRLHELNNLHSEFAILSALKSAPVYRLSKTWAQVSKKDKATHQKLAELFADDNNFEKLREHMACFHLPCLPYLGLFLTDLVFIDMAHPPTRGLDNHQRQMKMNNILRVIADFQQSSYELTVQHHIQNYLRSVRYIDELQKFVEEDNYKLSLKLEPPATEHSLSQSKVDMSPERRFSRDFKNGLHVPGQMAPRSSMSMPGYSCSKFIPSHRKAYSLGNNFYSAYSVESLSSIRMNKHLLDDSVIEDPTQTPGKDSPEIEDFNENIEFWQETVFAPLKPRDSWELALGNIGAIATFQECVRRKTVLKEGRKPAMAAWMRYWLVLKASTLYYYPPKSLRGTEKSDFKSNPSKSTSVIGWLVVSSRDPHQPDSFNMTDPIKGNVYKFKAGSHAKALQWVKYLDEAAKCNKEIKTPANLMSFE